MTEFKANIISTLCISYPTYFLILKMCISYITRYIKLYRNRYFYPKHFITNYTYRLPKNKVLNIIKKTCLEIEICSCYSLL